MWTSTKEMRFNINVLSHEKHSSSPSHVFSPLPWRSQKGSPNQQPIQTGVLAYASGLAPGEPIHLFGPAQISLLGCWDGLAHETRVLHKAIKSPSAPTV